MSKVLIIAEKPSVASDIARALGGCHKEKDFFESPQYLITSAIGHLLEIGAPEGVEVKRGKWNLTNLPVLPQEFALKPIEKTLSRLKLIQKFVKRADVNEIINACDAGREGELIFTYIMQYIKNHKPVKRLWLQSMTPDSIRNGFDALRQDIHMHGLRDAAMCRSEADWLIGINGTRALTAFNSKGGGFFLTPVGRVQTPTLTLVVEREKSIRQFVSKSYWRIRADFSIKSAEYQGYWFDASFSGKKNHDEERADRLWNEKQAQDIIQRCQHGDVVVEDQSKKQTQLSPLLYDLTSLQREANGRFGMSARGTLSTAQALYEKHKVITYPRTDSRALPEDYLHAVKETMKNLHVPYAVHAEKILKQDWVHPNKRIFNNKKISDHFAIVPTTTVTNKLNEWEEKVYGLIVRRFLAVFFPAAEYLMTTRISRIGRDPFKTEGKILVTPGWLEVYGKRGLGDTEDNHLPKIDSKEQAKVQAITAEAEQTRPPARFTEATLLSAMEGAGKLIDDEELKEAMKNKGLGTPATRAQIIEGLLKEEYIHREARNLIPTAKSFSLMNLLKGLEVNELMSAELTADWEQQLSQIERGDYTRETFMKAINHMTKHIVEQAKHHESDTLQGDYVTLVQPCPSCGGTIHENYRRYQCKQCEFSINKIIAGRLLAPEEVEYILNHKISELLQGFRSKQGWPFNAQLKLEGTTLSFHFEGGDSGSTLEWVSDEKLGQCPKCGQAVLEATRAYACEKSTGEGKSCTFRISKTILKRSIEIEQVRKLLLEGKTDLLDQFISKRNRPFKAFLVMKKDGSLGFEFENREKTKETQKSSSPAKKTSPRKSATKTKRTSSKTTKPK